jgi:hypothetical protein
VECWQRTDGKGNVLLSRGLQSLHVCAETTLRSAAVAAKAPVRRYFIVEVVVEEQ